ncbi:FlgD immunoglobulin-like domain containing protein [Micromonospora radicis]|uniref:ATP/GTP-binding protein n=1 Tax=Micromonospora radicis TaxID=1894971 RepID=A0A418MML3_9ACTN|nr:FlgD immunoglobulin-like domain containing protein [Micromonospora radicis]RIV29815.1 ATP/GTP-binding protein [Micromonospora radicis]
MATVACLVGTLVAVAGPAGAAVTAPVAMAVTGPVAAVSVAPGELVLPAAPRAVPRATRILNAGTTGFLWAQEGDDRLLWTEYATGATTALDQRLPAPLRYDFNGWWPTRVSYHPGWYGAGSDTVAVYSVEPSPQVTLLRGATGGRSVPLPQGRSYQGTFGDTMLTRTDDLVFHLLRDGAEVPVTGLPADLTEVTVEDGDARSVLLRYQTADPADQWRHWGLVDVATGVFTELPDRPDPESGWEVTGFRLAPESVLRLRSGRYRLDVLDRADLSAPPITLNTGSFSHEAAYGLVGSRLLAVNPVAPGNNLYRGRPLLAESIDGSRPSRVTVMDPAAYQIVQAPDGSALVAGADEYVEQGDLDWAFYRITPSAGTVQRHRVTPVQPMPAQIHGLALGSGILSTADASTVYAPGGSYGAYRSTWLTVPTAGGAPAVERATLDGLVSGDDGSCLTSDAESRCVRMFADGTGYHGREADSYRDVTMLYANGDSAWGPTIDTKHFAPSLVDLSGRYAVIDGGTRSVQYVGEFRPGAEGVVLQQREWVGAAVWGSTLWSGSAAAGRVTATRLPDRTVVDEFTTSNGCTATHLQAVGRWVHWACLDTYWERGSGVYDRVTRRHQAAPARNVLLGDGYLVEEVSGPAGGLRLVDLRGELPTRMLVDADGLGPDGPRTSWTVDRFGGAVAYADPRHRVHIVPTGIPASALDVIDSTVSNSAADWSGTWWLSKPAGSWQLTFRDAAGTTLRTVSGSSARGVLRAAWDGRDSAGSAVADGTFTWTLTAQPADGVGGQLSVAGPALPAPPPPPPAKLKATKAPSISGTLAVGSTVKAVPGTWSPAATSYAYQWSANGTAIKGATAASLKLTASLVGKRLTVKVTAKRSGHPSGVATSAASAKVAKGKAPKATKKPSISGTPKVGRTVKALVGAWSPKANSYRYEWRLNGKLIKGATGKTLKLTSSMRNKKLTVTVIARRSGHVDGKATSKSVTVRR